MSEQEPQEIQAREIEPGGPEVGDTASVKDRLSSLLLEADEGGTADLYARLVDEHKAGAVGDNADAWRREDEIATARSVVAARLFESPAEIGQLAQRRRDLLAGLDADRAALQQDPDVDLGRVETLLTQSGSGLKAEEARDLVQGGDPVEAFAAADQRYRDLLAQPIERDGSGAATTQPGDVAALRGFRRKTASDILDHPARTMQLAMDHPDKADAVLGLAGREEAPGRDALSGMVNSFLQSDRMVQEAGEQHDWRARAVALQSRRAAADDLAKNPEALLLVGEQLGKGEEGEFRGLTQGAAGRMNADIFANRGRRDPSRETADYEAFRDKFIERHGLDASDPVQIYGKVNEELLKSDALASTLDAPSQRHLDRMSQEMAGDIFQSGHQVSRLAEQSPMFVGKATDEAQALFTGRTPDQEAQVAGQVEKTNLADRASGASREETAVATLSAQKSGKGRDDAAIEIQVERGPSVIGSAKAAAERRAESAAAAGADTPFSKLGLPEQYKRCRIEREKRPHKIGLLYFFRESDKDGNFLLNEKDDQGNPRKVAPTSAANIRKITKDAKLKDHSQVHEGLALPLDSYGAGSGHISRELDSLSGAEVRKLYLNTVSMRDRVSERARGDKEAREVAHDKLEMGRRALAVEMVKRNISPSEGADAAKNIGSEKHGGLAIAEEIARDAHDFQSKRAQSLPEKLQRDPCGSIRNNDVKGRARTLMASAGRGMKDAGRFAGQAAKGGLMGVARGVKDVAGRAVDELT